MQNINLFTWLKIKFKVTYLLIGLNLLMFFLTFLLSGFQSYSYIILGAQVLPGTAYPFSGYVFELWRFITSAFLHGGLMHLLLNMYALYSIGLVIEEFWGGKKLLIIYILTSVTASLLSFIMAFISFWQNNSIADGLSISVGASGAIFGLVGVILGYKFFKRKTFSPDIDFNVNSLIFFVGFNLLFGFGVNFLSMQVYINNWAHLGGLIGGLILGAFLSTKNTFSLSKLSKIFENILYWVSLLLFIASFVLSFVSGFLLIFNTF